MIGILIPTFGRADRLGHVGRNAAAATTLPHEVVFIVEPGDEPSRVAAGEVGEVVINERAQSYAGAVNTAYEQVGGRFDWLFCASDDLNFHPGWDIAAVKHADDQFRVIGTNDLLNPYVARGWHATHYLIDRRYLDDEGGCVDEGPGSFLHEGYSHNYTDTEFIGTAKARVRFRPCFESVVEHLHFESGKSPMDATYEKSRRDYTADTARYESRRELWWGLSR